MDPGDYYKLKSMPTHASGITRYSQASEIKGVMKPMSKAEQYEQLMKQEQNVFEEQYQYQPEVRMNTKQINPQFMPQIPMMSQGYQMESEVYPQRSDQYHMGLTLPQHQVYNEYPDDPIPTMPIRRNRSPLLSQSMQDPFTAPTGYDMESKVHNPQIIPPKGYPRMQNPKMNQSDSDYYENDTLNQSMRLMAIAAMMNNSKRTMPRYDNYNQYDQYDEWSGMSKQPMYSEYQYTYYNQMQNIPRYSEPQKIPTPRGQLRGEIVQTQHNENSFISPKNDIKRMNYSQEANLIQENWYNQNMMQMMPNNEDVFPQAVPPKDEEYEQPGNFITKIDTKIDTKVDNRQEDEFNEGHDIQENKQTQAPHSNKNFHNLIEQVEHPVEPKINSDQKSNKNEFSFDDIPIQTKKLTFEELLAQNLK